MEGLEGGVEGGGEDVGEGDDGRFCWNVRCRCLL